MVQIGEEHGMRNLFRLPPTLVALATVALVAVARATRVGGSLNWFLIPFSSQVRTTLRVGTDCQQPAL